MDRILETSMLVSKLTAWQLIAMNRQLLVFAVVVISVALGALVSVVVVVAGKPPGGSGFGKNRFEVQPSSTSYSRSVLSCSHIPAAFDYVTQKPVQTCLFTGDGRYAVTEEEVARFCGAVSQCAGYTVHQDVPAAACLSSDTTSGSCNKRGTNNSQPWYELIAHQDAQNLVAVASSARGLFGSISTRTVLV